jgi:hypothetical protein
MRQGRLPWKIGPLASEYKTFDWVSVVEGGERNGARIVDIAISEKPATKRAVGRIGRRISSRARHSREPVKGGSEEYEGNYSDNSNPNQRHSSASHASVDSLMGRIIL